MKMKIAERYEVKWIDTFSFNGWYDDGELKDKAKEMAYFQRSVGIFAGEYHGFIILAMHENPHNQFAKWGHPDWIPKGCIKSIKRIYEEKRKT